MERDAPAKINYTLNILERRPDGYHNLRSIMQTVSLCDRLEVTRGEGPPGISLAVDGPYAGGVPVDDSNLVVRAVRSLLSHARIAPERERIQIRLHKRIPAKAGLGGGSSDAAAVLLLARALYQADIPDQVLTRLAASLGADIPFFLTGGTALVEGLGEVVTTVGCDLSRNYATRLVIVKPDAGVDTAAAYAALDAARNGTDKGPGTGTDETARWLTAVESGARPDLHNDFQPVILDLDPAVAACWHALRLAGAAEGGGPPLLCGSGAALFAECPGEACARRILDRMQVGGYSASWIVAPVKGQG
ncbi:MAG: 4-(cytidine 5'-diphospho)-2-C-methyl-D-erythritol kinase [Capsulimonadaceae bacterium]